MVAREVGAPTGAKAGEWRLLMNREVGSHAQAVEQIDWHRSHWKWEFISTSQERLRSRGVAVGRNRPREVGAEE